ncbi:hypothetical protein Tco_0992482 [Tanacetum coccineum]|uniref:Uncharacterized protein n=1 Tax=Tanacetum coccineum TaxID=301880 RepID=A0ABQ5F2X1_9ASTR
MGGPSTPGEPMSESSSTGMDTDVYGLEVGLIRRIQWVGYGVLEFLGVGTTHGYAVSSLMDTAYWSSE